MYKDLIVHVVCHSLCAPLMDVHYLIGLGVFWGCDLLYILKRGSKKTCISQSRHVCLNLETKPKYVMTNTDKSLVLTQYTTSSILDDKIDLLEAYIGHR